MTKSAAGIIFTLFFAVCVNAAEYREFMNQNGKAIVARVIDYDAEGGRVYLQLKNHRKAWVELSSLSEADQEYIRNMDSVTGKPAGQTDEIPTGTQPKELTRQQLEEIAELYVKAIMDEDYTVWSSLMADETRVDEKEFREYYKIRDSNLHYVYHITDHRFIKRIKIQRVRNDSIILSVYIEVPSGAVTETAALLLLPDGKIKYDDFIVRHPLRIADRSNNYLKLQSKERIDRDNPDRMYRRYVPFQNALIGSGVPLFGFEGFLEPDARKLEQIRSLDKICEWMSKNWHKWDSSDPKVFLPKEIKPVAR